MNDGDRDGGKFRTRSNEAGLDLARRCELASINLVGCVAIAARTGRLHSGTLHASRRQRFARVKPVGLIPRRSWAGGLHSHSCWWCCCGRLWSVRKNGFGQFVGLIHSVKSIASDWPLGCPTRHKDTELYKLFWFHHMCLLLSCECVEIFDHHKCITS